MRFGRLLGLGRRLSYEVPANAGTDRFAGNPAGIRTTGEQKKNVIRFLRNQVVDNVLFLARSDLTEYLKHLENH